MNDGNLIFDGAPGDLTPEALNDIYGEEDWSDTIRRDDDDAENAELDALADQAKPPSRNGTMGK